MALLMIQSVQYYSTQRGGVENPNFSSVLPARLLPAQHIYTVGVGQKWSLTITQRKVFAWPLESITGPGPPQRVSADILSDPWEKLKLVLILLARVCPREYMNIFFGRGREHTVFLVVLWFFKSIWKFLGSVSHPNKVQFWISAQLQPAFSADNRQVQAMKQEAGRISLVSNFDF